MFIKMPSMKTFPMKLQLMMALMIMSYKEQCTSNALILIHMTREKLLMMPEVSTKRLRLSDPQFNFQRNCFLCGHECPVVRDPKNPSRFRESYLCLSAEDGKLMNKDVFIRKCEARGDEQSADIMFRLLTVSDLAASDYRYHKDCFSKLCSNRVPQQSSSQDDLSFKVLLKIIKSDVNRIWTSSSFAEQYSQLCNEKNNHGWTKERNG